MTFGNLASRGGNGGTGSLSSISVTLVTNTIAVDRIALVMVCTDNIATADSTTSTDTNTHTSVTDSKGNTYTKVGEWNGNDGGAGTHVCVSFWFSRVAILLTNGVDSVTANFSTTTGAARIHVGKVDVDAGNTIGMVSDAGQILKAGTAVSVTVSGPQQPYLYACAAGVEGISAVDFTQDAAYTALLEGNSGGTTDTHVSLADCYRIVNGTTGDTYDCTLASANDAVHYLTAMREVTPGTRKTPPSQQIPFVQGVQHKSPI